MDGLRGLAVLLVMLMHTGPLDNGYIGVDVFFVLSGVLITTLLSEEWERTGGISLRRFYERRARRLLPALWLLVAAFVLVALLADPFSSSWPLGRQIATTGLFANNWVTALGHGRDLGPLSPTWTLAQEAQFYLLWPLGLWMLLRRRVRPAVVVCILALAIVALVEAVPHARNLLGYYSDFFSPLDRAAELLLGCVAAVMWRHRLVPRPLEWRATGWAGVAGLACLLLIPGVPRRWVYLGAAVFAAALMLSLLAQPRSMLGRIVSVRPLRYTGTISYGLYLCHLLIGFLLQHYLPGRSAYVNALLVVVASFAVAAASWHLVESRAIRGQVRRPLPA